MRAPLLSGLLLCLLPVVACAEPPERTPRDFSAEQVRLILQHGPWPLPWQPDRSNRVSGNAAAADLGRRLFFDARLSPSGRVSCSSCHRPERAWTDGRPQGRGLMPGRRNTPGLADVRLVRWFGWGGAGDSLWGQSLRPLLDPIEMGASAEHVQAYLGASPELAGAYTAVFGRAPGAADTQATLVDAAKALAAYQETIVSARTRFDELRDALARADWTSAARYPPEARRGLALFIGQAGCSTCHAGPAFTTGGFAAAGRTGGRSGVEPDQGRREGIATLLASPFNQAGRFNDDPARRVGWDAAELMRQQQRPGAPQFRVPGLRNVMRTAPYMHDGALATINDVLGEHPAGGPRLSRTETADLIAFLATLSPPPR